MLVMLLFHFHELCCNPQDQPASFTESQLALPSTPHCIWTARISVRCIIPFLLSFHLQNKALNLSRLVVSRGAELIWWDLLPLVYWCLKLYGSHKGISLTLIYPPLIFFLIFVFVRCLRCVKKFMRFLVHASPTSHNVVTGRYSAVHATFGRASGAVPFITASEPCTVCELPPFHRDCSWVTVTGLRLQRRCGFSHWSNATVWLCVCVTDESHQKYWPQSVAASSGKVRIKPSQCAGAAPQTWASKKLMVEEGVCGCVLFLCA